MTLRYFFLSLMNIIMGVIGFFLGLRIIFRLFAANPSTPFVSWIYSVSDYLVSPFQGIFPSPQIETGSVFDVAALIAFIAYALAIYLITALVDAIFRGFHSSIEKSGHAHVH